MTDDIKNISRDYIQERKDIADKWMNSHVTEENIRKIQSEIENCDKTYKERIRDSKIKIILNDSIPGEQIQPE